MKIENTKVGDKLVYTGEVCFPFREDKDRKVIVIYIGLSFIKIDSDSINDWGIFSNYDIGGPTEKIENYRKVNNWIKL